MTVLITQRIVAQCQNSLARAAAFYPALDFTDVEIKFSLKGINAGRATRNWDDYCINFNMDYAIANVETILNDVVHHEVAHIAMFKGDIDCGHGLPWKKLCIALGGSGAVKHNVPKIFSKGKTYEYITTTGCIVRISEHMHLKICAGAAYRYSLKEGDINSKCVWHVV